jgi:hypothetical protein
MKDHAKVELLFSIFDANGKLSFSEWHDAMAEANMFAEVLKKADLLFVMISSCFQNHVKRKAEGEGMSAVKQVLGLGQKESCIGCLMDDCSFLVLTNQNVSSPIRVGTSSWYAQMKSFSN